MEKLTIYNKYAEVPQAAQKTIKGGRLNGMTDINPMWRIKCLTEMFGACGFGWYAKTVNKQIIDGANGEKVATVDLELYINVDGEWSAPIEGSGGSMFVSNERNGAYTSDEAFKMAYTDALSVCCKMLGFGANVYWKGGRTKYDKRDTSEDKPKQTIEDIVDRFNPPKLTCDNCSKVVIGYTGKDGKPVSPEQHIKFTQAKFGKVLCLECAKAAKNAEVAN